MESSTEGPGGADRATAAEKAGQNVDELQRVGQFTGYGGISGRHGTSASQGGGFSTSDAENGGNQADESAEEVQVVSLHDASGHDGPVFGDDAQAAASPLGNSPARVRDLDPTLEPLSGGESIKSRDADQRRRDIEQIAYRRYEARGGREGSPDQDWLDAEGEVDGGTGPSRTAPDA